MAKYKIGYIDEDEQEVKMFRRKLRDFDIEVIGYKFSEDMSKEELLKQVYNSDIDLLLIDYKLKGTMVTFNGEEVEREIYDKKPLFPYIIFTSNPGDAENYVEDLKNIYDKEELSEDNKIRNEHFVKIIEKSIEQYRNHIAKKKNQLSELLSKGEKEGLNAAEKSLLIETQRDLQNLDKTKPKEIPEQLLSYDKLEDLSKTRKEAEQFLESLIKSSKK